MQIEIIAQEHLVPVIDVGGDPIPVSALNFGIVSGAM